MVLRHGFLIIVEPIGQGGGEWYVGRHSIYKDPRTVPHRIYLEAAEYGRRYQLEAQAEQALIFQRRAMRFFRWCVENDPGFKADDLLGFLDLVSINHAGDLYGKLLRAIESGEVEF